MPRAYVGHRLCSLCAHTGLVACLVTWHGVAMCGWQCGCSMHAKHMLWTMFMWHNAPTVILLVVCAVARWIQPDILRPAAELLAASQLFLAVALMDDCPWSAAQLVCVWYTTP